MMIDPKESMTAELIGHILDRSPGCLGDTLAACLGAMYEGGFSCSIKEAGYVFITADLTGSGVPRDSWFRVADEIAQTVISIPSWHNDGTSWFKTCNVSLEDVSRISKLP